MVTPKPLSQRKKEKPKMEKGHTLLLALSLRAVSQTGVAQSSLIAGQVTKVDQSAGKITIKHGPIKKLGMDEGMTMVFKAQDPAMLKVVKFGDKVKFDADEVNGQLTVTKIQKAK
jgi:Cu(I)/Ag(I) efflux system protein CusF